MTRSKKQLDTYLIESASELKKDKLPKNIDVLRELVFVQDGSRGKLSPFIKLVMKKVMGIWSSAGLPTQTERTCIKKLTNLHQEWKKVKYIKNEEMKQKREEKFMSMLNELCDIGPKNMPDLIDDDLMEFLVDQRCDEPVRVIKDIKKVQKPKKIQPDVVKKAPAPATRGRKRKAAEQDAPSKDDDSASTGSAEQEQNGSADESSDGQSDAKKLRKNPDVPTEE
ncbi:hypothetical protein HCN44_004108 [Aphidius gifuensis]|uniref:Uncharacterized protein n=1 Tax=Aphidius gifuensis TaxID=684658 RepID=A0A834Y124_APHGI|nr:uncharacterized protein LOC122848448 [Aphidius gifuensis]KAF7994636.1 hypothetical protein HCN44_004108 [Aphidius gifuensis]